MPTILISLNSNYRMWANAQRDGHPAEYIGGALCSTPQAAKPVEICWGAPNSPTDLSR